MMNSLANAKLASVISLAHKTEREATELYKHCEEVDAQEVNGIMRDALALLNRASRLRAKDRAS